MVDDEQAIELPVRYSSVNAFAADYLQTIRLGGKFVPTQEPRPLGTTFCFVIEIPGNRGMLRVNAKVNWVVTPEEASDDNPAGLGLSFVFNSESERIRVEQRVRRVLRTEFGDDVGNALMEYLPPSDDGKNTATDSKSDKSSA